MNDEEFQEHCESRWPTCPAWQGTDECCWRAPGHEGPHHFWPAKDAYEHSKEWRPEWHAKYAT